VCVLGACEKLRKVTISFVVSICTSVLPSDRMEQRDYHWTDFHEILYLCILRKTRGHSSFIKIGHEVRVHYMKTNVHLWSYFSAFFLEWEIFLTKIVEKVKTHILCSGNLSRESCPLWHNGEKYGRAGQATDDNLIWRMHFCLLDNQGCKHALRMCNTYFFSNAAVVSRTHLSVTFLPTLLVITFCEIDGKKSAKCQIKCMKCFRCVKYIKFSNCKLDLCLTVHHQCR
jgi:hypothetical protein